MPVNPWEIQEDDSRREDSIATYIIFCEDETDEPYYFRSFGIEKKLRVNAIPNQKQGRLNFLNTVTQCVQEGKMEYTSTGYKIKEDVTENIWSVYDRDLENTDIAQIAQKDDVEFTTSIHNAIATGIKVAWSNDAFELWVLLHFEVIPTGMKIHRNYIYERLTDIFRKLPNPSAELREITSNPNFYYKSQMKKRANFLSYVLPLLKQRTNIALQNAIVLAAQYRTDVPCHDRNPCTMVHHLVRELSAFEVAK